MPNQGDIQHSYASPTTMAGFNHHTQIDQPALYEELNPPSSSCDVGESDFDDVLDADEDVEASADHTLTNGADSLDPSGGVVKKKKKKKKKTTVAQAVFSYICTCVGAGVLSLPGALRYMGWTGLILMFISALACNHTAKYLIRCMFAIPGRRVRSYEDIGEMALGPKGRTMVAVFQTITLFGVCTIFLILIGGNMNTIVPKLTLHVWVFIFGACLIPVAWLKTMREVSYLAIFGVLASLFVAGVVVAKGFHRAAQSTDQFDDPIKYQTFNANGISQCFNLVVFAFGCHSVLPNIVVHMAKPQKNYKRMTGWSYIIIALIFMLAAAGGYAGWGLATEDNILNNMDDDGPRSLVVTLAYVFITAHVVLAYPIPLNPVSLAVEHWMGIDLKTGRQELLSRITVRSLLVLLSVFIASVVPYFGELLSLVSALSVVAGVFIFPPWFYYLLYRHRGFPVSEIMLMIFLGIIGVCASTVGVYYAIKDLIHEIQQNPNPFDHYFS